MLTCTLTEKAIATTTACMRDVEEIANYQEHEVASVKVGHLLSRGMRGVPTLITNVSTVDPQRGLIFRGHPIRELSGRQVLELLWLGLTGSFPDSLELTRLSHELNELSEIPSEVIDFVEETTLDDTLLILAGCVQIIGNLDREPDFYFESGLSSQDKAVRAIHQIKRLIATIIPLIGLIDSKLKGRVTLPEVDWRKGWGWNMAKALSIDPDPYADLLEKHGIVHIDQGKGNPSSLVSHVVAMTGAEPSLCLSAALLTLSGPSHAYAGIGVLGMLDELLTRNPNPSDEDVLDFLIDRLGSGKKVYGIGQAVMKGADTRYLALAEACMDLFEDRKPFRLVEAILRQAPEAFMRTKNKPIAVTPNVNMISAVMLHCGLQLDRRMLPIMFASSRSIGNLCQFFENLFLPRAVHRPLSVTTCDIKKLITNNAKRSSTDIIVKL